MSQVGMASAIVGVLAGVTTYAITDSVERGVQAAVLTGGVTFLVFAPFAVPAAASGTVVAGEAAVGGTTATATTVVVEEVTVAEVYPLAAKVVNAILDGYVWEAGAFVLKIAASPGGRRLVNLMHQIAADAIARGAATMPRHTFYAIHQLLVLTSHWS
jgi:hypothetical protein